jgi:putative component of toxin-antitoxin plasmid stabilization module
VLDEVRSEYGNQEHEANIVRKIIKKVKEELKMGEEIILEKIEVVRDAYQLDFRFEESGKGERCFISKQALFAMICVAEKEESERMIETATKETENEKD